MRDIPHLDRRGLLAGAAGVALAGAASPALAQFPSLSGLSIPGGPDLSKYGDLIGQVSGVIGNMQLTEADELAMGNGYYENFIDQSGGRYNSSHAQEALHRFAEPLIATSKRRGLPWDITLVDNDTVNAWALPGGKIAVHKGLIRYCAAPEELAAVISHEIGHAELSHGIAQIKNKKFVQGMGGIAKQQIVDQVGRKAGSTASFLTSEVLTAFEGPIYEMVTSGYSQDLEYAADAHIVGVFHTVGYDSQRAPNFYNTLLRLLPPGTKATTSLYSTHPGTKDRIKRLQKVSQTDKTPIGSDAGHPGWAELKESFPTRTVFRLV